MYQGPGMASAYSIMQQQAAQQQQQQQQQFPAATDYLRSSASVNQSMSSVPTIMRERPPVRLSLPDIRQSLTDTTSSAGGASTAGVDTSQLPIQLGGGGGGGGIMHAPAFGAPTTLAGFDLSSICVASAPMSVSNMQSLQSLSQGGQAGLEAVPATPSAFAMGTPSNLTPAGATTAYATPAGESPDLYQQLEEDGSSLMPPGSEIPTASFDQLKDSFRGAIDAPSLDFASLFGSASGIGFAGSVDGAGRPLATPSLNFTAEFLAESANDDDLAVMLQELENSSTST